MSNIGSRQGSQSVIAQEANVRDSGNFVGSKLTIKKSQRSNSNFGGYTSQRPKSSLSGRAPILVDGERPELNRFHNLEDILNSAVTEQSLSFSRLQNNRPKSVHSKNRKDFIKMIANGSFGHQENGESDSVLAGQRALVQEQHYVNVQDLLKKQESKKDTKFQQRRNVGIDYSKTD